MTVYWENLHYTQKFEKWAYNESFKPRNYAPGDKILLNNKYIKTKQNQKLKTMFFRLFQMLYPISKQAYKLELPKK